MTGVQFLHNVSLFAHLSHAELEPLARLLVTQKYREGEQIFAQNSLGKSLYIVKAGCIGIVITAADDTLQMVAKLGPGQVFGEFGLLDGLPRSAGAMAYERSELLVLSRPEFFMYLEQHPSVAITLLVLLSRRLRFATQASEHDSESCSALSRLAHLLADFSDRYGTPEQGGVQLPIRLTQGELAGILGCPRAETEGVLEDLQARGLIAVRGLQMQILDLQGLRALAER